MQVLRALSHRPSLHQFTIRYTFVSQHKMSTSAALYTSASLKAANAPTFGTLQGKVDSGLLQSLNDMGFDFMTPVQAKVMSGLPTMNSDW